MVLKVEGTSKGQGQPARQGGPQSHNHMKLNSFNSLSELGSESFQISRLRAQPAPYLKPCEIQSRKSAKPTQTSDLQNCETMNQCCLKLLDELCNNRKVVHLQVDAKVIAVLAISFHGNYFCIVLEGSKMECMHLDVVITEQFTSQNIN